jgi:energy-coupling factor transport system ATP-binding protein
MLLQLENAGLVYQKGTAFEQYGIKGVSLTIEQGERVGIAGPIGSGKSSLIAVMSGIDSPDEGSLVIDGVDIGNRDTVERGSIGVAFQSPENNLFEKSVFDDVAFAPRSLELEDSEVKRRVEAALMDVGLDPDRFGPRNPFSLSSGEQRRVALAGVLALEPQLLLLDEPTAYLDPHTREDIITRLTRLNREQGTTIVIVGHDMDELAEFAERMVIMDAGSKVVDGSAAELLTQEELLQRHGLEAPGTVKLCRLLSEKLGRPVEPVLDEARAAEILFEALQPGGAS